MTLDAAKLEEMIGQLRTYIEHYKMTCEAFEFDKSGLADHVRQKRNEMIKESRESLEMIYSTSLASLRRKELLKNLMFDLEKLKDRLKDDPDSIWSIEKRIEIINQELGR